MSKVDHDMLVPLLASFIQFHDWYKNWVLAMRTAHPTIDVFYFLSALSGSFWFLSQFFSHIVLKVHDALDESLASLLAVVYNAILGLLFSAVLVQAIIYDKGGSDYFLAYEAAGFAFTYLALGAVYAERSGEISEYAILGYAVGLIGYLAFCVHTSLLGNPAAATAFTAVRWVSKGWLGKIAVGLSLWQAAVFAWHAGIRMAKSKISRKR